MIWSIVEFCPRHFAKILCSKPNSHLHLHLGQMLWLAPTVIVIVAVDLDLLAIADAAEMVWADFELAETLKRLELIEVDLLERLTESELVALAAVAALAFAGLPLPLLAAAASISDFGPMDNLVVDFWMPVQHFEVYVIVCYFVHCNLLIDLNATHAHSPVKLLGYH